MKNRSNILLEIVNDKMSAIICDFGLARISSDKTVFFFFSFSFLFINYFSKLIFSQNLI